MTDREKIVRAIETCFDSWIDKHRNMGLDLHEVERMKHDALELLKGQEPHVMTLDEAVNGNGCYYVEFRYHLDMGWVKCDFDRMYLDGEVAMLFSRDKNFYQQKEHYGQLWRLWNKQPTYDQRKAAKWE